MKTFNNWIENYHKNNTIEVGSYKVEVEDGGDGKLLLTVSSKQDAHAVDSKGIVRKMIDVSSLQSAPAANQGKIALTASTMKAPMMDRMEPMDNYGAGGLPST